MLVASLRNAGTSLVTPLLLAACATASPPGSPIETADSSTGQTPATASPSEQAPVASSNYQPDLSLTWTELPFPGDAFAVTSDGDRLVAAGQIGEERAAWTSANGTTWEAHDVPAPSTAHCDETEPVCIERSARMGPMVRLDDTLYSFGATEFFNDFIKAVGWRWTDGQDWQVIESANAIYKGGAFRAVASSDSSIFAVTHAGYEFTERHWLWRPDTSWREIGVEISHENPIQFLSVAWSQGMFLAVGARWTVSGSSRQATPVAWSSADGAIWEELGPPDDAGRFCAVTATGRGLFTVGLDEDGWPITWQWTPGSGWDAGRALPTPTSLSPFSDPSLDSCIAGVLQLTSGYVAFVGDEARTLTWTSRDGRAWAEAPTLSAPVTESSIAALGDTIVAFSSRKLFIASDQEP